MIGDFSIPLLFLLCSESITSSLTRGLTALFVTEESLQHFFIMVGAHATSTCVILGTCNDK